jgi:hypothetical protein
MKKAMLVLIALLAISGAAFGQSFTVQSVSGRVERETGGDKWAAVKAGDVLTSEAVIRSGIGARLVLVSGERTFSVGAVQTGTIASLAGSRTGIRIDGRVAQTDTGEVSRTTGRVSTASARASDAAEEEDIAAE